MMKNKCCTPRVSTRQLIESLSASNGELVKERDALQQQLADSLSERSKLNQLLAEALAEQGRSLAKIAELESELDAEKLHNNQLANKAIRIREERDAAIARAEVAEQRGRLQREKEIIELLESEAVRVKELAEASSGYQRSFHNGEISTLVHLMCAVKTVGET